jgi:hypothetical protein
MADESEAEAPLGSLERVSDPPSEAKEARAAGGEIAGLEGKGSDSDSSDRGDGEDQVQASGKDVGAAAEEAGGQGEGDGEDEKKEQQTDGDGDRDDDDDDDDDHDDDNDDNDDDDDDDDGDDEDAKAEDLAAVIPPPALLSPQQSRAAASHALREAAREARYEVIADLLDDEGGAEINAADRSNGWTALHWAARVGALDIVELLLHHGADHGARGFKRESAHDVASWAEQHEVEAHFEHCGKKWAEEAAARAAKEKEQRAAMAGKLAAMDIDARVAQRAAACEWRDVPRAKRLAQAESDSCPQQLAVRDSPLALVAASLLLRREKGRPGAKTLAWVPGRVAEWDAHTARHRVVFEGHELQGEEPFAQWVRLAAQVFLIETEAERKKRCAHAGGRGPQVEPEELVGARVRLKRGAEWVEAEVTDFEAPDADAGEVEGRCHVEFEDGTERWQLMSEINFTILASAEERAKAKVAAEEKAQRDAEKKAERERKKAAKKHKKHGKGASSKEGAGSGDDGAEEGEKKKKKHHKHKHKQKE